MLIGSMVKLHDGLHSCLCFSRLEKLFLKASSTPPRYLAICRAFSTFSYRNPDSFSTPGGSIEKVTTSSIASRHLVDRSSFCSWICWVVPRHFLDTCICRRPFSRYLPRQIARHVSTPSSVEIYWGTIYSSCAIRSPFHSISLSIALSFSLPNNLISLQSWSSRFLQAFSRFSSLGKLLISHSSCISCFET